MIMPRAAEKLLLPANPWFIAFTLVVALMLDMIPLGRVAAMPDVLAVVLVFWGVHQPRRVGVLWAFVFGLAVDVHDGALLASTTPLRSLIRPRLGTMGTTAMRLDSARSAKLSCWMTCSHTSRATSSPKQNSTKAPAASTRSRKRDSSWWRFFRTTTGGSSDHNGRCASRSGARRCGASSSRLARGHRAASNTGASSTLQPGHMPPTIIRTTSASAWAAKNSGAICTACAPRLNQARRRCSVIAPKLRPL